jgi:hypothetical protein
MRHIDSKYKITGELMKQDGTPIPADEPLFLFRAQDRLLPKVLDFYIGLRKKAGSSPELIVALSKEAEIIKRWQKEHRDRTRMPL